MQRCHTFTDDDNHSMSAQQKATIPISMPIPITPTRRLDARLDRALASIEAVGVDK